MSATVTALKATRAAKVAPVKTPRNPRMTKAAKRAARHQTLATIGVASVALTLTALSLSHLTTGIEAVTGGSTVESAAMAVGIDLGFIALEIAQILKLREPVAAIVHRFAQPAVIGTIAASAALNAFGFASHASGAMVYPAIAMGCAIPGLIYALTRVAVALAK